MNVVGPAPVPKITSSSLLQFELKSDERQQMDNMDLAEVILNQQEVRNKVNKPIVRTIDNMADSCRVFVFVGKLQGFAEDRYTHDKRPKEQWTHNVMSGDVGGGLVIPQTEDAELKFQEAYAEDVANGQIHYMIERRTKYFHFHVDFDIKRNGIMDEENIVALMKDLLYCVKKFYPETTAPSRFDVVVGVSLNQDKTGIHPVFPNLIVDVNQAFDIRNYFVAYLTSKYGDMAGVLNSWEDIVDTSVYEANGLRMIGSHKAIPCTLCSGSTKKRKKASDPPEEPRPRCEMCHGRGKVDNGRYYVPYMYIRDGEVHAKWTEQMRTGGLKAVKTKIRDGPYEKTVAQLFSIRAPTVNSPSSDFAISDKETARMATRQTNTTNTTTSSTSTSLSRPNSPRERIYKPLKTDYGTYRVTEEDYKGLAKFKVKKYVDPQSEGFKLVQEYINSRAFPLHWRQLKVHDMFSGSGPTPAFFIVNVRGEGQRYCLNNRNGEHKSNNVYFKITPTQMTQKCFCSCQTTDNRRKGKCENFESENLNLPSKICKILFPVAQQKLGHLTLQRQIGSKIEMDEYTHSLAEVIAKMDDEHKQYEEDRAEKLQLKPAHERATEEPQVDKSMKRRRKKVKTTK